MPNFNAIVDRSTEFSYIGYLVEKK